MEIITINGKRFHPYISAEKIAERIQELSEALNQVYKDETPIFLPILNGAFMFTSDLVKGLNFLPDIQFVKVSSYGNSMESTRQVQSSFGLNQLRVKDRHILIIEDIIDSGFTCGFLKKYLEEQGPASVRIISLLFKPKAFEGDFNPDFIGFEIANDFVIGYGMDYAQQGRSLDKIYQLAED